MLKCIWKGKGNVTIFEKVRGVILSDFKTHSKAIVIETSVVLLQSTDRSLEHPEVEQAYVVNGFSTKLTW